MNQLSSSDLVHPLDQSVVFQNRYSVQVGSQTIDVPIVAVNQELAIALLITVDMQLSFIDQAGLEFGRSASSLPTRGSGHGSNPRYPGGMGHSTSTRPQHHRRLTQDPKDTPGRCFSRAAVVDHNQR
jgi:hypothetical protein